MKYSICESKVSHVANTVTSVDERLAQILENARGVVQLIDQALNGAVEVVTAIDTEAATGDELWLRLQARKNEVRADVLDSRARAAAIITAIETELNR